MLTIKPIGDEYKYSEVRPFDDCKKEQHPVFNNEVTGHNNQDIEKWALDTAGLANKSIYAHTVELILKIPSYFISKSDLSDQWWAKTVFVLERFSGTFGDMFRNFIYGHRDRNGNLDDNIGAEINEGANPNHSVGVVNYHTQTKGKFLVAALGFISPTLANDLEWALVRALDSIWWRNMGIHLAFGPNFTQRLLSGLTGSKTDQSSETTNHKPIDLSHITGKFKEHFKNTVSCFPSKNKGNFLDFCQNADKFASCFLPVFNCLNIIGDLGRPIARRLDWEGIPRNLFRILSVIDKPIFWLTNTFRFYLPEKYIQRKHSQNNESKHKVFNNLSYSDLLAGTTIADILDFGLIVFEDKLKDSSGSINHIVEIARKIKDSASDIYFSARRRRAAKEFNLN